MLPDSITGASREVDVVAKTTVSTHDLYLSIECRDHKRSADVTWVESMAKKHESLPTSKLVLWSKSGFTRSARQKAKALKIDTVSQAEAKTADWAKLARKLSGGSVFHVAPTYEPFIDVQLTDGSLHRLEDVAQIVWFNSSGDPIGNMPALLACVANHRQTGKVLLDHAPTGKGNFYMELCPPEPWFVDFPTSERAAITRIGVSVFTDAEHAPLKTASATDGDSVLTLATAELASGQLEFLVEESNTGRTLLNAQRKLNSIPGE